MANTPDWYVVVLLGFGTVFIGLICLIYIIKLMSVIIRSLDDKKTPAPAAAAPVAKKEEIVNRGEFVAAVSAAIATAMGTDVSGLRIHSIKKVN